MALCPVCGSRTRVFFRWRWFWRCKGCGSGLSFRETPMPDEAFIALLSMSMFTPFLLDVVVVERAPGYCLECGYNLRGNVSGVCSECGTQIPIEQRKRLEHRPLN